MSDPYFPLYVKDWRGEQRMRTLSFAARGLWLEIMLFCAESGDRGRLVVAGKPLGMDDAKTLAAEIGEKTAHVKAWLAEIDSRGIFSVDDDGVIYSRRIRRDAEKRAVAQANGRRGGNPALKKSPAAIPPEPIPPDKGQDKLTLPYSNLTNESPSAGTPARVESIRHDDCIGDDEIPGLPTPKPEHVSAISFARWFVEHGIDAGVIDAHHRLDPVGFGRSFGGLEAAARLLDAYGREECEKRATRLFAAVKAGTNQRNSGIASLDRFWSKPDIAGDRVESRSASPVTNAMMQRLAARESRSA